MSLVLHPIADRDAFVKDEENNSGKGGYIRAYADTTSIAIGYGFDLLSKVGIKNKSWNADEIIMRRTA